MDNESRSNQLMIWNTTLGTLDKWVTLGYVDAFARIVQAHNMVEIAFPMYYKVWFLCLLGKWYVQLGQYEKGTKQVLAAIVIWNGKGGWQDKRFDGNESAKMAHDKMLGGTFKLCELGIQGKLDARGQRWKEVVWDMLVLRNNNLEKKRPTDSEIRDVSDKVGEASALLANKKDLRNEDLPAEKPTASKIRDVSGKAKKAALLANKKDFRNEDLPAEKPTDSEIQDVSETLGKASLREEDEARPGVSEKANVKE